MKLIILFLFVYDDVKSSKKWYLDRGCINYVSGNQNLFEDLDRNFSSDVGFGDGKKVRFEGKGNISINTNEGNKEFIDDVNYSPNIYKNLLSIGKIMRKGYKLIFDDDKCEIFDEKI